METGDYERDFHPQERQLASLHRIKPVLAEKKRRLSRLPRPGMWYLSSWRDLRLRSNAGHGLGNTPEITPPSHSYHRPDGTPDGLDAGLKHGLACLCSPWPLAPTCLTGRPYRLQCRWSLPSPPTAGPNRPSRLDAPRTNARALRSPES